MKIFKKLKLSFFKKMFGGILILLFILYLSVFAYSYIFEKEQIIIDEYNFKQLEKVKTIMNSVNNEDYKFYNLRDFNILFNSDIKPITNCYYLKNRNVYSKNKNGGGYIFGFKFESLIYKLIYFSNYYSYPDNNLPKKQVCLGSWNSDENMGKGCYDSSKYDFTFITSNSCKDD